MFDFYEEKKAIEEVKELYLKRQIQRTNARCSLLLFGMSEFEIEKVLNDLDEQYKKKLN